MVKSYTLKDISYETDFFWKGIRFTQVIRPKNPKGKFTVICRPTRTQGKWVEMPGGRKIKPVLYWKDFYNQE